MDPHAGRRAPGSLLYRVVVGVGLAALVAGTFLPWLRSGEVDRNAYAAGGVARRYLDLDAVVRSLLRAWPFLSLLCAVAVALLLLGLVRTGSVVAVVCAVAGGVASGELLATAPAGFVGPASTGPSLTLAGSCLVLVTVIVRTVLTGTGRISTVHRSF